MGTDPRCWAKCNPTFFTDSYFVADCSGTSTSPETDPVSCGQEEFENKVLLEKVQYLTLPEACTPPQIQFTNLLRVGAKKQPNDGYRMEYELCKAIDSTICGGSGGLSVDCGCTKALDDGRGETTLSGVKYIRFCDADLDDWTLVGLRAMVDEIRDNGVCCGMTGPKPECDSCDPPPLDEVPKMDCDQCAATSTRTCP
jgi:hypothetical protein